MAPLIHNRGNVAIILAALAIACFTLSPESGVPVRPFDFCILCGTYGSTNLVLNAMLFLPLGAALRRKGLSFIPALVTCLAITITVELLQLLVVRGRYATLGDIFANAGGGGAGWLLAAKWHVFARPNAEQGLVLSVGQAAVMVAAVLAGGWLFQSAPTSSPYYAQIAPVHRERGAVNGLVSAPLLNGDVVRDGPIAQPQTDAIRAELRRDRMSLQANLVLRSEKQRQVLILRVVDRDEEELGLLGIRGKDAVFAVRTRATEFALFQPHLVLAGAFQCDSCNDGLARQPLNISGYRRGVQYDLTIAGEGIQRHTSMALSGNMTWLTMLPDFGDSPASIAVVTFLWIMGQSLLLGYWLVFSSRAMRSPAFVLSAAVLVAAITQLFIPILVDTTPGSVAEWTAVLSGVLAGTAIATLVRAWLARPR